MAKVTITIEDDVDNEIIALFHFDKPISIEELENSTQALKIADRIMGMITKLRDTECSVKAPFKSKPKMEGYYVSNATDTSLTITDIGPWDKFPTVTNRIEKVVEELKDLLGGRKLYVVDSGGQRDRVLIENGKFAGWYYGGSE